MHTNSTIPENNEALILNVYSFRRFIWFLTSRQLSLLNDEYLHAHFISVYYINKGRSQCPRGLRHELSSLARTLGSNPTRRVDVCVRLLSLRSSVFCLAAVLPTVYRIKKLKQRPSATKGCRQIWKKIIRLAILRRMDRIS
jgi:hypothetical protein